MSRAAARLFGPPLATAAALALLVLHSAAWAQDRTEIVTSFKGHAGAVYSVAFTPDKKLLATGSLDDTVALWDIATGKLFKQFGGPTSHTKQVYAVAVSPDGSMLASGSADNTLKLWDVPLSAPIKTHPMPDAVRRLALSPDGLKVALALPGGKISIVTALDFKEIAKFEGPPVAKLAWTANGLNLIAGGDDGSLRMINIPKNETTIVGAHRAAVVQVLATAGGVVSAGVDGTLRTWTLATSVPKTLPPGSPIVAAAVLGDSMVLAGADKSLRFVQLSTQKEKTFTSADVVAVANNGQSIAAVQSDGRLSIWNVADGKLLGQAFAGPTQALAFTPQNQLATTGPDGLVRFWSLPLAAAKSATSPTEVVAALATPTGKLVTAGGDRIVRVFEMGKMTLEKQFPAQAAAISALSAAPLVTGGADGALRHWDVATGKESASILAHAGPVSSIASLGQYLVSTGVDGAVKTWSLPSLPPKAMAHADVVTHAVLTRDGAKLVTASADRAITVWNAATAAIERSLPKPEAAVVALALSPDGQTVAAATGDKSIHLRKLADGKAIAQWKTPIASAALAFSADGQTLAIASDAAASIVKLADAKDGKEPKESARFAVKKGTTSLAMLGDQIVVGSADGTVQVLAAADGAPKRTLMHTGPVVQVAVARDRLAVAGGKSLTLWSLVDGKRLAATEFPTTVRSVGWSGDGSRLAVGGDDKLVRLLDAEGTPIETFAAEGAVNATLVVDAKHVIGAGADKFARLWTSSLVWQSKHAGPVASAVLSAKSEVYAGGADKLVHVMNLADGKEVRSLPQDSAVLRLALSSDSTKLAVLDAAKKVHVWNLAAATKPEKSIAVPPTAVDIALNVAGQHLAVAAGNEVHVYDLVLGKEIQVFRDHAGPVERITFLDAKTLVTAGKDNAARLLTIGVVGAIDVGSATAALHFNAAGAQMATGGIDKTVRIWDVAKKTVIRTLGPKADAILTVMFSPDGTQIAAAVGDVVTVWKLADGKEIVSLPHPAPVRCLAWNQNGQRLATGCDDKQSRLWELPSGRELQYATFAEPVRAVALDAGALQMTSVAGATVRIESVLAQKSIDVGPVQDISTLGNLLYAVGADKSTRSWGLPALIAEKTMFPLADGPLRAVAVAKNQILMATGGDDKSVRVFSVPNGKLLGSTPVDAPVRQLLFSANSQFLVANLADGKVIALTTTYANGQPLPAEFLKPAQTFAPAAPLADLVALGDGLSLLAGSAEKAVTQWKIASPLPVKNFNHNAAVLSIAFPPKDSTKVATGCHDGRIRIFDIAKTAVLKQIDAHVEKQGVGSPIYSITYSPDGSKIMSASFDHSVKIWNATSGALVRELKGYHVKDAPHGHFEEVYSAAFSPDGKLIATGSGGVEKVIKLWKADDGSFIRDLVHPDWTHEKGPAQSHPGWVTHLQFLRDGRLLAVGDAPRNEGYLSTWDTRDGRVLQSEALPFGTVYGFALSGDEKLLAIGAGSRGNQPAPERNQAYLIRVPGVNR